MQSRRQPRLIRFRRNKRRQRQRLRQRIFFSDTAVPDMMEKPRVVVLTGAGISAESGIQTFRAADGLWEAHRVEAVATPAGFARDPALVPAFYNAGHRAQRRAPGAGEAGGRTRRPLSAGNPEYRQPARARRQPAGYPYARRTAEGTLRLERPGAGVDRGR